jgi:hypothetical protein
MEINCTVKSWSRNTQQENCDVRVISMYKKIKICTHTISCRDHENSLVKATHRWSRYNVAFDFRKWDGYVRNWIEVTQVRVKWRNFQNTVMNLWDNEKLNFPTNWQLVSFKIGSRTVTLVKSDSKTCERHRVCRSFVGTKPCPFDRLYVTRLRNNSQLIRNGLDYEETGFITHRDFCWHFEGIWTGCSDKRKDVNTVQEN